MLLSRHRAAQVRESSVTPAPRKRRKRKSKAAQAPPDPAPVNAEHPDESSEPEQIEGQTTLDEQED